MTTCSDSTADDVVAVPPGVSTPDDVSAGMYAAVELEYITRPL